MSAVSSLSPTLNCRGSQWIKWLVLDCSRVIMCASYIEKEWDRAVSMTSDWVTLCLNSFISSSRTSSSHAAHVSKSALKSVSKWWILSPLTPDVWVGAGESLLMLAGCSSVGGEMEVKESFLCNREEEEVAGCLLETWLWLWFTYTCPEKWHGSSYLCICGGWNVLKSAPTSCPLLGRKPSASMFR